MAMEHIAKKVDHTALGQAVTWTEIQNLCNEGLAFQTASVCIPPSYVKDCKEYLGNRLTICTVIGFPNGYQTTKVKVFETEDAIANGADEIDMVINQGWVKDGKWGEIQNEIAQIKQSCGNKILKVIIETCFLTEEEKIHLCSCVTKGGGDYIKTSTGFGTKGATKEDIMLFKEHIGKEVKMKAAGGIRSLEDGEEFIQLGVDRLGTSSIVKLLKGQEGSGY